MLHLILLSGGSGTRLWPLSNSSRSKQFLKVLRDASGDPQSMMQRVFSQIAGASLECDVTIATCANQENSIRSQLDGGFSLVLEPERRDTAPAIMLACANLELCQGADLDDVVVVLPIDTYADQAYYERIPLLEHAVREGRSSLVLLGIEPTCPSSKFGYIIPDCSQGEVRNVREFKEKPTEEIARSYIEQGALWNCGVFAFKLGYVRDITSAYISSDDYRDYVDGYPLLPKTSFDYAVVEKARSVSVITYSGTWKDLGTWNALTQEMADPAKGRVVMRDADNVHAINETGLPMVVSGLKDAVVVATHDGILACSKDSSDKLKESVALVAQSRPMYEKRHWGEYRVLDYRVYDEGNTVLTKEISIDEGSQLSYQRHAHRSEVWTVVSGEGEVAIDGVVSSVSVGSTITIAPGQMHSVRASTPLHFIEVQLGSPLVEDDIERFGYFW